jgi:hypothetical protein
VAERGNRGAGSVAPVIDVARIHNWIALLLMVLIIGFILHQLGQRVATVGKVVTASFGS